MYPEKRTIATGNSDRGASDTLANEDQADAVAGEYGSALFLNLSLLTVSAACSQI